MNDSTIPNKSNFFIFFGIALALFMPRGIGLNITGAVIDVSELSILFLFLLIIPKIKLQTSSEKIFFISALLPVFFLFFHNDPFLSMQRYIFYFIFCFTGYFLGKELIQIFSRSDVLSIVENFCIWNSFFLVAYFLNDYFNIIDLSSLRQYDPDVIERLDSFSRILSVQGFSQFTGYSVIMNNFSLHQSILFSFIAAFYFLYHKQLKRAGWLVFYIAIIISASSIALSQSRGPLLFCMLLLLFLSIWDNTTRKKNNMGFLRNPALFFTFFSIFLFAYFYEQALYIIINLSTLLNYFDIPGIGGEIIQGSDSKRIIGYASIPEIIFLYPHLLIVGAGEGFWGYSNLDELNTLSDLSILVTFLFEFGIIVWVALIWFILKNFQTLIKSKNIFDSVLIISFISCIFILSLSSMKESYWLFFTFLGMISQRSILINENFNYNDSFSR